MTHNTLEPSLSTRRRLSSATLAVVALGLTGCGAMQAQNPSGSLRPVNAVEVAPDARAMLK
jgi:hypothetical protein